MTVPMPAHNVSQDNFNMVMARFEPENNIDMVLEGVVESGIDKPILVIGNHNTKHGEYLKKKFASHPHIRFMGGIYNLAHLDSLRYFSSLYFHGHSVGGTNPSLLEAMASGALICAHENDFNKGVLADNGFYFPTASAVAKLIQDVKKSDNLQRVENNLQAIRTNFNWEKINSDYLRYFERCLEKGKKGN
ncbi:MAG: glycosyltransferase [Moraxellaceae bacterium]|nr:MAG: glycosyltransferase [Moraxellaceae bacterium]